MLGLGLSWEIPMQPHLSRKYGCESAMISSISHQTSLTLPREARGSASLMTPPHPSMSQHCTTVEFRLTRKAGTITASVWK
eukprot:5751163-Pyramimonas_sp.AAC.1